MLIKREHNAPSFILAQIICKRQIAHDVRSLQWLEIITQCENCLAGITAKQWTADNGISEKSYYNWL